MDEEVTYRQNFTCTYSSENEFGVFQILFAFFIWSFKCIIAGGTSILLEENEILNIPEFGNYGSVAQLFIPCDQT